MYKVAIVQPLIPHYRESFFLELAKKLDLDVYVYMNSESTNIQVSSALPAIKMKSIFIGKMVIYDIRQLFLQKYKIIVIASEMKLVSNWPILLIARLLGVKVILWGHGFNARYYDEYNNKLPIMQRLSYRLAAGAWFYTENELKIWNKYLPSLKSVSLNNTIDVEPIFNTMDFDRDLIKNKYKINTKINLIFCARFSNSNRRADLLVKLIEKIDKDKFGFIIIGGGTPRPDFSKYVNVYDFGEVYQKEIKDELFALADIYFQPGAIGLSVVEAMAYGKPVMTFRRSSEITQGVEYNYIHDQYNGKLFDSFDELYDYLQTLDMQVVERLGSNARQFVKDNLTMTNMVEQALSSIGSLV